MPVKESNGFVMDPTDAIEYVDENTIGIIVIFGSTYTGHFEDVALMSELRESPLIRWLRFYLGATIPIPYSYTDDSAGP